MSDELAKSDSLKNLKTFDEKFVRFLNIAVFLQNAINTFDKFDDCFNNDLFFVKIVLQIVLYLMNLKI